ncbi:MAG: hypothetical protein KZQ66_15825 [Candidatus Thiodiazotropha sp. (ex Lucinoma aequizonata)]|nr:hypothetical protein [Candidatus Thiodiazotropha sp. (ex Lucinoma aequizonata)]MCU7888067.1 hypothetical protein [Candidatus Thiodiazotropha sp. (ex Lucinoma aequizonata)]MCU7895656.1 hypothetical protein [Candidatus Thiodiazotropha sp. (ex Lucinoma aequizonata)]MCU7899412.1 hypothetical protein [Candidatus Thiodiazotropha sp. (ex Lucinoma aequizonata)]MCU7903277.1 hypothetical protein [Candidatus Thiodiazotropha sp. (ex Lucinoma aequizonata)]
MDWSKIIWAVLLGAMIPFLWPRAKQMLKNSPKAEQGDWQAVLLPIVFVVGFVILLIMMV